MWTLAMQNTKKISNILRVLSIFYDTAILPISQPLIWKIQEVIKWIYYDYKKWKVF